MSENEPEQSDMIAIAHAKQVARETPMHLTKSGIAAKFIRIDETWGIKYYEYKEDRDHTYKLQKRACKFGVAPRIGSKFTTKIDGYKYYGYVTECIVETQKDKYNDGRAGTMEQHEVESVEGYAELIQTLLHKVKTTDVDIHWANVGWLPDGRLVAIDFSEEKDLWRKRS